MDPKIDVASLRRLSELSQEQLNEVDAPFQHKIAAIHEKHQPAARGVSLDPVLREAIESSNNARIIFSSR